MKINIHDAVAAERAENIQQYYPLFLPLPHPFNAHDGNHEKLKFENDNEHYVTVAYKCHL